MVYWSTDWTKHCIVTTFDDEDGIITENTMEGSSLFFREFKSSLIKPSDYFTIWLIPRVILPLLWVNIAMQFKLYPNFQNLLSNPLSEWHPCSTASGVKRGWTTVWRPQASKLERKSNNKISIERQKWTDIPIKAMAPDMHPNQRVGPEHRKVCACHFQKTTDYAQSLEKFMETKKKRDY